MFKHIISYSSAKIITGMISFLSILIFARIFTPSELGNYYYIMSILTLGTATIFSWIRLSSFRFFNIHTEKNSHSSFYSFVFTLNLIFSILILSIIFILYFFLQNNFMYQLFVVGTVATLVNVFFDQSMSFLRSELDSRSFAIYSIIRPIIKLFVILFLTHITFLNEVSIFWGMTFSGLVVLSLYFYDLKVNKNISISYFPPWKDRNLTKDFFIYGYPLTFSFLFSIILSTSDRIMIEYYLNSESVAIYSMGYDLSNFIITNIFMVINLSFYPIILKLIDSDRIESARIKLKEYFLLQNIVLIPLTLTIYLFAEEIAKYILGNSYYNTDTILTIKLVSISTFILGIKAYFFDFAFQIGKNTKLQIYPVIIAAIMNIILNFNLIPKLGLKGALLSTILSYISALIISIILGKRAFKLNWYSSELLRIIFQLLLIVILYHIFKFEVKTMKDSLLNFGIYILLFFSYLASNFKTILKIIK